jgi:hypothetical protein
MNNIAGGGTIEALTRGDERFDDEPLGFVQ